MKFKYVPSFLLLAFFMISCNSCVEVQEFQYNFERYKSTYVKPEQAEKALVQYITDRTVRVVVVCKIINNQTYEIVKDSYDAGWGTGTIIASSKNYSFIQTANHVAVNKPEIDKELTRTCDGFAIEQRDVDNKVISMFRGKVEVVAASSSSDIAVLKVYKDYKVTSRLARDTYLGQSIRIVGFPFLRGVIGNHLSYEKGHISTRNMGTKGEWMKHEVRWGSAGFFGNSGGAVWNQQGEIVGTVVSLMAFRTLLGEVIPQQNCLYGPGTIALRAFYKSHKELDFILGI